MQKSNTQKFNPLFFEAFFFLTPIIVVILYYLIPAILSLSPTLQKAGGMRLTWDILVVVLAFIAVMITRALTDPTSGASTQDVVIPKTAYESTRNLCSTLIVITGVFVGFIGSSAFSKGTKNLSILLSLTMAIVSLLLGFIASSILCTVDKQDSERVTISPGNWRPFWWTVHYQFISLIMSILFVIPGLLITDLDK